jgi:integrase
MRRKKILSFPKLNNRKEDITRDWYVEVGMRNPKNGEYERRRFSSLSEKGVVAVINDKTTVEGRYVEAQKIIDYLNRKIKSGWTFFNDVERCVYDSQIQYSNEASVYKRKLSDNSIYEYLVSAYLKEKLPDWDISTQVNYKGRYRKFGFWLKMAEMDSVDISAITNDVIIRFFNYLKLSLKLSRKTYASYAELLKAFFDSLVCKNIIEKSPVYNLPKNNNVKDMGAERIRKADLGRLMKKIDAEDPQLAIACRFEYYCAMRPGQEIRLLKVKDIDFRRGLSKVRITITNAKASKRREVTIPDVFLDYLLEQGIDKFDPDYYVIGRAGKPGQYPLGRNTLRTRFNKHKTELGLPDENKFYSMKHTGGVTLAERGEPLINIRDHFGHSSIAITEAYLKRHGFNESKTIRDMDAMY